MKGPKDGRAKGGSGQSTDCSALTSPDASNLLHFSALVSNISPELSVTPF